MIRLVCLYSPMAVLFTWAALLGAGLETRAVTITGRILLGVTLALHIRQEWRDRT